MKKRKKKKIKLKSMLFTLLIIMVISALIYGYTRLHITNIYVLGNKLLTEQEIIDEAELSNYPEIYQVSKSKIEEKLLKNKLIKTVNVSKSLFGKVTINISENKILYKEHDNYMLSNGQLVSFDNDVLGVPLLINEIDNEILNKVVNKFSLIDESILISISEIEYKPSLLDKERFMFYMNDGNYVYVTLSKIELINSYNEIYPTLEGNKGILYLDSGNHFEIKKKNN